MKTEKAYKSRRFHYQATLHPISIT